MTGCRRRVVCLTDAVDTVLSVPEDSLGAQPCTRHRGQRHRSVPGGHRVTVSCIKGRSGEARSSGRALSLGVKEADIPWGTEDVRCLGEAAERVQQAPGSR